MGAGVQEVGEAMGAICAALGNDRMVNSREMVSHRIVDQLDENIEKLVAMRALAMRTRDDSRS